MQTFLIVGLGNYPSQYNNTKHNVGFSVVDNLCKELNISLKEEKFNGLFTKINIEDKTFIIAKPLTLMNLSGNFVSQICNFFKIDNKDVVVVHDDADSKIGLLKFRQDGSSGGQNGVKDIINKLSTEDFIRIKIGIGRPNNKNISLADYVLSKFDNEQMSVINNVINQATNALIEYMNGLSLDKVINKFTIRV
ncbi:MAG: aminoacyl-tRNA hydrolase [Mycoplasmataceae bacterium]|jgi:PTH1 family peptidyl-tRNA hydrolase|nr:aminoacyl-tRNA hydrolase [Mycoplasmataceae bacterium]